MRKNFERIIFAVSVCVLSGVLFIQGVLYLKDLGFADDGATVTAAIKPVPRDVPKELALAEIDESPLAIEDTLIPVELALAEESDELSDAETAETDSPASNGPALEAPGKVEPEQSVELERTGPSLPFLLKPDHDFPQTPGPLMPPLNAEPLTDGKKTTASKADQLTRSIIREHLPHATEEELQIWFEELQGVPPKVASDMLSIRKLLQPKSAMKFSTEQWEPDLPELNAGVTQQPVSSSNNDHADDTGFIGFSSQADRDELIQRLKPTVDALRLSRDVIVNNIANAGTIGFKRSYVEFEALPYEYLQTPASEDSKTAPPIAIGMGSQVLQTRVSQMHGEQIKTGRNLDLAIEGDGFLQVQLGQMKAFTRNGRLMFDGEGRLCIRGSQINYVIQPEITLPEQAHSVQISETGEITAFVPGEKSDKQQTIGTIHLACFTDATELFPRESCLFVATPRSGAARVLKPGATGAGKFQVGVLETSNVSIPEELEALSLIKQRLDALKTVYSTEPNEPVRANLGLPSDRIARPEAPRMERNQRSIVN